MSFLLQPKSKVWGEGEFLTLSIVAVRQNLCPGSIPTVDAGLLCYTFALWLPTLQFQVEHRLLYFTHQKLPSQCRQEPSHLSQLSLSWSTHLLRPLVYVTLSQQYRHGFWGGSFHITFRKYFDVKVVSCLACGNLQTDSCSLSCLCCAF